MRVDLNAPIYGITRNAEKREPIKEGDKEMTLGSVIVVGLLNEKQIPGQAGLPRAQKTARYRLYTKIQDKLEADPDEDGTRMIELKSESVTTILEAVADVYPPLIYGQVEALIDGKAEDGI